MQNCDAIILAGGLSSRMGRCKAELMFNGKSFLDIQIDKMLSLGIGRIMVSGYESKRSEVICVKDNYSKMGPLAGIQSCLQQAYSEDCLVIGVDIPLIKEEQISALLEIHFNSGADVTLLKTSKGDLEPVIGVYKKKLEPKARLLLDKGHSCILDLFEGIKLETLVCDEDKLCMNVNTPEEYDKLYMPG